MAYVKLWLSVALAISLASSTSSESISKCSATNSTVCSYESGHALSCCPVRNGVCCANKEFCCPIGFECDEANSRCLKGDVFMPFHLKMKNMKKTTAHRVHHRKHHICADNSTSCGALQTCCPASDNKYGCCPIANAVCCNEDFCCPENYECKVEEGKCQKKGTSRTEAIDWLAKVIVCPGGDSQCPTDTTCCQTVSGEWGCCPLPNAVCCTDGMHCCPEGSTCDLEHSKCKNGHFSFPFYHKIKASPFKKSNNPKPESSNTVCPGGDSTCPIDSTCCQTESGDWACCPLVNATCCSDHLHCCPEGYTCDVAESKCNKGNVSISFFKKEKAIVTAWLSKLPDYVAKRMKYHPSEGKETHQNLVCADNKTTCNPLATCCKMSDNHYGCCKYPNAVCCSKSFCCPPGHMCGKKTGECIETAHSENEEKKADKTINEKLSDCPSNSTTCQRQLDGASVCCPYQNGTCCGVHGYCCPKHYTCDAKQETCVLNDDVQRRSSPMAHAAFNLNERRSMIAAAFQMRHNSPLNKSLKPMNINNQCSDNEHFCTDSTTCCSFKGDSSVNWLFNCCPFPNASCCDDGLNCCPNGYKCLTNSTMTCVKDNVETQLPLFL